MKSIITNPVEVTNRLSTLDITKEEILEVVSAMVAAKSDSTENDPPSAPGWLSWCFGTRRLREVKRSSKNWEKDDTDQISSVINRKLGIKIVVSNTDDSTGLGMHDKIPQNRSKKGAATERNIASNQSSFLDKLEESLNVIYLDKGRKSGDPITTWYLCVYHEGDAIRAELSCPKSVDNGFFSDFIERITIISNTEESPLPSRQRVTEEKDMEFDIPVARK